MTNEEKGVEVKEKTAEEIEAEKEAEEEKQLRLESFKKAGEIHKQIVEFIKPQVKVGAKYLDICEAAEDKIHELGGEIGFPLNISVNEIACHYTSSSTDESVIEKEDVVKIDIGVAVEGYVADGAFTVSFNTDEKTANLVTAVETAVMKGLSEIKAGVKINSIGKVTSEIIKKFGYTPIKDLAGHMIEKWSVHAGKDIPNIEMPLKASEVFEVDEVYALECFASTGVGNIHQSINCEIYGLNPHIRARPRTSVSRKVIGWLNANKKTLPFSTRELLKEFKTGKFAIRQLLTLGKLVEHNVLKEKDGIYVAQYEHTFMVTEDGINQLT